MEKILMVKSKDFVIDGAFVYKVTKNKIVTTEICSSAKKFKNEDEAIKFYEKNVEGKANIIGYEIIDIKQYYTNMKEKYKS